MRSINPYQKKEMELLASKIRQGFMSSSSSTTLSWVSPSAYDTAWVAMVPHPDHPERPLFPRCLQWVIGSQRQWRRRCGFWGQTDARGCPTLDCLTATFACMAALKTWAAGDPHCIEEGMEFLLSRTEELLAAHCGVEGGGVPRWFAIVFPGMLELAGSLGLNVFRDDFSRAMEGVFEQRRRILADDKELHDGGFCYPPLESFLEALPADHAGVVDCAEVVASHQDGDGSLFRSPSVTAFAFMATGDARCRAYLEAMVAEASVVATAVVSHGVGVPAVYPGDELLRNLVMVEVLEGLGVAEHFAKEIADAVLHIHSNWARQQEPHLCDYRKGRAASNLPLQLYQDAVAFRLLRTHGYRVSPGRVCWFLHDGAVKQHMEKNYGRYLSAMLNVYRATHLGFPGDEDLEEARSFSKRLLQKGALLCENSEDGVLVFTDFQSLVLNKVEREHPYGCRMVGILEYV